VRYGQEDGRKEGGRCSYHASSSEDIVL
jgi:hypothetical protein